MQPSRYPVDWEWLSAAWRQFVATGVLDPNLDPIVAMSWQRCALRYNPLTTANLPDLSVVELEDRRNKLAHLIALVRPFMEDIHQLVENAGYIVVLLDASACVLEIIGDAAMRNQAMALGLRPGCYWSEGHAGTNAFGLALYERCPIQVAGAEHFFAQFHSLSTSAAPIYNWDGKPIGILGMACHLSVSHMSTLGMVYATARAIEHILQADKLFSELNMQRTQLNAIVETISEGLIMCDREGLVLYMNTRAAQILDLKLESVVGRPLSAVVEMPPILVEAMQRHVSLIDTEVSFQVRGLQIGCLMSLSPTQWQIGEMKPIEGYIMMLRQIDQVRRLVQHMVGNRSSFTFASITGKSSVIHQVRRQAQVAARSNVPVLIVGESGTGKSVLARAIHNESVRAEGPFVTVNCRVLPRDMILGDFLGYETDMFRSDGRHGRPGKFELAHGGTLHLEEIEELPLEMQAALLRVIETGEVMRLGGWSITRVDVRLIVTTAANLEHLVLHGDFRADLYYALSRMMIRMPPLRERPADIPLLIRDALRRICRQIGRSVDVSYEAQQLLRNYRWPGNLREMESALERAALLTDTGVIEVRHLPDAIRKRLAEPPSLPEYVLALREAEYDAILRAARAYRGNVTRMAHALGIGRTTLWRKLKAANINLDDFKKSPLRSSRDPASLQ